MNMAESFHKSNGFSIKALTSDNEISKLHYRFCPFSYSYIYEIPKNEHIERLECVKNFMNIPYPVEAYTIGGNKLYLQVYNGLDEKKLDEICVFLEKNFYDYEIEG